MTDDPRAPFFIIEEQTRASIEKLLDPLSDEQLDEILNLFHASNHSLIPFRYWGIATRVRAHILRVQKKRKESAAK